jgi:hypothetical protein
MTVLCDSPDVNIYQKTTEHFQPRMEAAVWGWWKRRIMRGGALIPCKYEVWRF